MFFSPGDHFGERGGRAALEQGRGGEAADGLIAKHFGRPPPVGDRAAVDHWEEIKGMDARRRSSRAGSTRMSLPGTRRSPAEMEKKIEAAKKLENRAAPKPTSDAGILIAAARLWTAGRDGSRPASRPQPAR